MSNILVLGDYRVIEKIQLEFAGKSTEGPLPLYKQVERTIDYLGAPKIAHLLSEHGLDTHVVVFRKEDSKRVKNSILVSERRAKVPIHTIYFAGHSILLHVSSSDKIWIKREDVERIIDTVEKFKKVILVDRGEGVFTGPYSSSIIEHVKEKCISADVSSGLYNIQDVPELVRIGGTALKTLFGVRRYHLRNITSFVDIILRISKDLRTNVIASYEDRGVCVYNYNEQKIIYIPPIQTGTPLKTGVGDVFFATLSAEYIKKGDLLEACLNAMWKAYCYIVGKDKEVDRSWKDYIVEHIREIKL